MGEKCVLSVGFGRHSFSFSQQRHIRLPKNNSRRSNVDTKMKKLKPHKDMQPKAGRSAPNSVSVRGRDTVSTRSSRAEVVQVVHVHGGRLVARAVVTGRAAEPPARECGMLCSVVASSSRSGYR